MFAKLLYLLQIAILLSLLAIVTARVTNPKFPRLKTGSRALKIAENTLPVVNTNKGTIKGSIVATKRGNYGYAFQNIPYAQPPIGDLRFRAPKPALPWSGVKDCGEYGPACYQPKQSPGAQTVQDYVAEDCLTMNVYVPFHNLSTTDQNNNSKIFPVLYIIHGGGWEFDSPRMYPVESIIDNFVSKGLIVTFVTYRLAVFGFFTTGTDDMPGNQALQDIILGLKWVQDEIHHFHGNPSHVTIQGESSAGSAVELLSFMPQTKGLFHQLIVMSGGAFGSEAVDNSDVETYKTLANDIGCNNSSDWERGRFDQILSCLQQKSAAEILQIYDVVKKGPSHPRVDGPGGLLPNKFEEMAASRRPMPMMIGTLLHESGTYIGRTPGNFTAETVVAFCQLTALNQSPTYPDAIYAACYQRYIAPFLMQHNATTDHLFWHQQAVAVIDEQSLFTNMFKDAASMRDVNGTVYLYSLDYVKKGLEGFAPWHAMDLTLLFDIDYFELFPYKTPDDIAMSDLHSDLFCNFAKYGNPTPPDTTFGFQPWLPLESPIGFNYYSISLKPANRPFYHFDALMFWDRVVPSLSHKPDPIDFLMSENILNIENVKFQNLIFRQIPTKFEFNYLTPKRDEPNLIEDKLSERNVSHNDKRLGINDSRYRLKKAQPVIGESLSINKLTPDADSLPWIILLALLGCILLISIIYVIVRLRKHRSPEYYERYAHPGRTGVTPRGSRQTTPRGSVVSTPRGSIKSRSGSGRKGKDNISGNSSVGRALAASTRMSIGVAAPSLRRNTSHEVYSYTHYKTIKY